MSDTLLRDDADAAPEIAPDIAPAAADDVAAGPALGGGAAAAAPYQEWLTQVFNALALRRDQRNRNAAPAAAAGPATSVRGAAPRGAGAAITPLGRMVRRNLFGTKEQRETITDDTRKRINEQVALDRAKPVKIKSSNGNELSGNLFSHNGRKASDGPDTTRPVVLFLSGSGGSAEDYGTDIAEFYQEGGASALAVNYGGYGGSSAENEPTEESLYQDGQAMLQHLLDLGWTPDKIIIHGFSLGGAVAGKLEAHNAKGRDGNPGKTFRGLVLDRPMLSTTAGVSKVSTGAAGLVASAVTRKTAGSMSARKAIKASNSTTPMVIASEQQTTTDEKGQPAKNHFAATAERLREQMKGKPRTVTGAVSSGDHFAHDALIASNGQYMKDLIDLPAEGAPAAQPEVGTDRKTVRELRKMIEGAVKERNDRAIKVQNDVAGWEQTLEPADAAGPEVEAAKAAVRAAVGTMTGVLDELTSVCRRLAGLVPRQKDLEQNANFALVAGLQALVRLKALDARTAIAVPAPAQAGLLVLDRVPEINREMNALRARLALPGRDAAVLDWGNGVKSQAADLREALRPLRTWQDTWTGEQRAAVVEFDRALPTVRTLDLEPPAAPPKVGKLKSLLNRFSGR